MLNIGQRVPYGFGIFVSLVKLRIWIQGRKSFHYSR
jgi:hypothetical protein